MSNISEQLAEQINMWINIYNNDIELKRHSFGDIVFGNVEQVDELHAAIYKIQSSESVAFRASQRNGDDVDEASYEMNRCIYQRYIDAMDEISTAMYSLNSLESDPETMNEFLDNKKPIELRA